MPRWFPPILPLMGAIVAASVGGAGWAFEFADDGRTWLTVWLAVACGFLIATILQQAYHVFHLESGRAELAWDQSRAVLTENDYQYTAVVKNLGPASTDNIVVRVTESVPFNDKVRGSALQEHQMSFQSTEVNSGDHLVFDAVRLSFLRDKDRETPIVFVQGAMQQTVYPVVGNIYRVTLRATSRNARPITETLAYYLHDQERLIVYPETPRRSLLARGIARLLFWKRS